ncbi:MAG: hypothetical protein L7S49_03370 [Candidatus Poseidoniaceae archaeon]|nr:hypothetical protein [Candidatus Poseidoniaceae archaeon]
MNVDQWLVAGMPYIYEIGDKAFEMTNAINDSGYNEDIDLFTPEEIESLTELAVTTAEFFSDRSDLDRAAEYTRKAQRARRAYRASAIAAGLAVSDGPLPVGDILAITFLTGYAGYELYHILT